MKRADLSLILVAVLTLSPFALLAATPAELAEDVAVLVASGAGILMPDIDEPHVEDRGVLPLTVDFPAAFQSGLVPRHEFGVATYPVSVQLDAVSGDAVFFNADGTPFYVVPRIGPANWLSLCRPLLAPDNPWFALDRVVAVWTLVPEESLEDYLAARTGRGAPAHLPLRGGPSPSLMVTNLMFTAISVTASNVVLDVGWPAEAIPANEPLDLYFATNLAAEAWTLLATEFPASPTNLTFSVDGANLPGFLSSATAHVHNETCVLVTNIIAGVFLSGEVETNVTYSCATNPPGPAPSGFFRVGTRQDTDGDGLPDAYEQLVSQTSETSFDTDGDGLGDGEEQDFGTDPLENDTDGDGLGDGDEQGSVQLLPFFQWTDIVPATNLLAGLSDMDGLTRTVPLPVPVSVIGTAFDRVTVSLDGCVQFLTAESPAITVCPYANSDLGTWKPTSAATNELLLAVNACDLQSVATNGTQLLVGTSPDGSAVVVEYRDVSRCHHAEPATFQAVIPTNSPGLVQFNYLAIPPSLETNSTQIATQDRRRRSYAAPATFQTVVWCRNLPADIQSGMSLLFHTGTGTDPFLPDTDGDGLADGTELYVHRTNPLLPDTDGDGLSDSVETQYGLNPVHSDTDGDGLPDGWEMSQGLAPNDASDADADADQDGVANYEEYRYGSDPWVADTDGDALSDFAETPRMRKLPASAVPWYDMTDAEVLSPTNTVDDAVYSFPLSAPALVCGVLCTNLLVDSNGLVTFASAARDASRPSKASNANLETTRVWQYDPAIAAYWDDLKLRPELGSALLATNIVEEGGWRCVVEYRDVGFYADATNSVTFQVSFLCGSPTNTVFVRYGDIVDSRQGSSATFGAQGPDRFVTLLDTHNATNFVAGTVVAYEFGTGSRPYAQDTDGDGLFDEEEVALGTNPHLADTDGDGLSDNWEVENGISPLSAQGDDGWNGDPDGDGRINALEMANGSSPQLCDSNGDGIPDGMSGGAWSNHVLRASVAGTTNLLVAYTATVPAGGSCALRVGPLTLPLSGTGAVPLCLEPGTAYDFRLAATGGATASLSLQNPAIGGFSPPSFFLRDPNGVFGGTALSTGVGAFGFLTLGLRMLPEGLSECIHEIPGIREYEVQSSPLSWTVVRDTAQIEGFAVQGDGHVTLAVADTPPSVATGTITVPSPFAFYPSASVSASIHRCEGDSQHFCGLCGDASGASTMTTISPTISACLVNGPTRIHYQLTEGSPQTANWSLSPIVENGALLYTSPSNGTGRTQVSDVSEIWVEAGSIPQKYEVRAEYPGCSRSFDVVTNFVCRGEVCFAEYSDDTWSPLPEEKVVLSNQPVRIRIRIYPSLPDRFWAVSLCDSHVKLTTSDTCPAGGYLELAENDLFLQYGDFCEIRMERPYSYLCTQGFLPSGPDFIPEKVWMDVSIDKATSLPSISDSLAFNALVSAPRGICFNGGSLTNAPPAAPVHKSFFQAAGRELAVIRVCETNSPIRQLENQANYFYFSGHGLHSGGMLANETSVLFGYTDVTNHWNKDLDCVIFAACSVLDIGDYNGHFTGSGVSTSPGIGWATTGPRYILGYNYTAPGDDGGKPAEIISYWVAHHTSDGIIEAWMNANRQHKAWNACAIDTLLGKYYYFRGNFFHALKLVERKDYL